MQDCANGWIINFLATSTNVYWYYSSIIDKNNELQDKNVVNNSILSLTVNCKVTDFFFFFFLVCMKQGFRRRGIFQVACNAFQLLKEILCTEDRQQSSEESTKEDVPISICKRKTCYNTII